MRHWLNTEWDVTGWSDSTIEHAICGTPDQPVLIRYRYQPEQVELIAREVLPQLSAWACDTTANFCRGRS